MGQTVPPLLDIRGLGVGFTDRSGRVRPVLRDIDLRVEPGSTLGLVGESGSGKSTLALAAMAYLKPGLHRISGEVRLEGQDLFALPAPALQRLRGGVIGLVPQNAGQALTPTTRVGAQIEESLQLHSDLASAARQARVLELLEQVRLPQPHELVRRYPHELSGGQQQRVAIAMALAGRPRLLLLDEPTTGLDVTTQAHVLDLLRDINRHMGTAMVYVSHDLGAIARVCDRVDVLYAGEVVLEGATREVLRHPAHPYPQGLLASIPRLSREGLPTALAGRPPAPGESGAGCAFEPRCALAKAHCREHRPELRLLGAGTLVRCHRAEDALVQAVEPGTTAPHTTLGAHRALALRGLGIRYARPTWWQALRGQAPQGPLTVEGVDLDIQAGETVGLVGESGSGKSSILKSVAGLLPPAAGTMHHAGGKPLPAGTAQRSRGQLRQVQLVFQNPDDSLNPRHTVATLLAQPLELYFGLKGADLTQRSIEWLERVRLGPHYMDRLPGQMSGGEKQRVAIARAFAAEPDLVLCDEVTSALDVSVQAAVLEVLQTLKRERSTAYLFVSHDLAVVRALADRVAVLYQGRLCEIGPAAAVYAGPSHPYTEVLLGAVLEPDPDHIPTLRAQDLVESGPPARGCPFQRRCPRRLGAVCDEQTPPWQDGRTLGHRIRCHIPIAELGVPQDTATEPPR